MVSFRIPCCLGPSIFWETCGNPSVWHQMFKTQNVTNFLILTQELYHVLFHYHPTLNCTSPFPTQHFELKVHLALDDETTESEAGATTPESKVKKKTCCRKITCQLMFHLYCILQVHGGLLLGPQVSRRAAKCSHQNLLYLRARMNGQG